MAWDLRFLSSLDDFSRMAHCLAKRQALGKRLATGVFGLEILGQLEIDSVSVKLVVHHVAAVMHVSVLQ